jgi:hypothetical protein
MSCRSSRKTSEKCAVGSIVVVTIMATGRGCGFGPGRRSASFSKSRNTSARDFLSTSCASRLDTWIHSQPPPVAGSRSALTSLISCSTHSRVSATSSSRMLLAGRRDVTAATASATRRSFSPRGAPITRMPEFGPPVSTCRIAFAIDIGFAAPRDDSARLAQCVNRKAESRIASPPNVVPALMSARNPLVTSAV